MARYTIIGVAVSTRLAGGVNVIETVEAVGITSPHEVNFSVTVDKTGDWKAALAEAAAAEAAELESVFDL